MTQDLDGSGAGATGVGAGRGTDLWRDGVDVLAAQLDGLRRWHLHRRSVEEVVELRGMNRELRLDLQRRQLARTRQQEALLARAAAQLVEGERLLRTRRPRVVLVHRHAWVRGPLAKALVPYGVEVLAELDDGADAVGVAVAEQPDVLLVEDALPTMTGEEVLRTLRTLCPQTAFVAHVADERSARALLAAGAGAAFPRRTPPEQVARELVALLGA